jgi:hypothetical protein
MRVGTSGISCNQCCRLASEKSVRLGDACGLLSVSGPISTRTRVKKIQETQ